MFGKWKLGLLVAGFMAAVAGPAHATVLIHEILADPPAGVAGDANHDGVTSSTQDEFIELFNSGHSAVDISGWHLNDAIRSRHVFPASFMLLPRQAVVVFGGGTPNLPGINWLTASSGGLSLNNTAETVSLFDQFDHLLVQVIYGPEGNLDQSLVRSPEGGPNSPFIGHLQLANADGKRFSAGYLVNSLPEEKPAANAVPEIPSIHYLWVGMGLMLVGAKINLSDRSISLRQWGDAA